MRDGKASTELVRNSESSGVDELAVVDRSGRLQIPREYLSEANIQRRARIDLTDGKVTIKGE